MQHEKLVALFHTEFERCRVSKDESVVVLSGERSRTGYAKAAMEAIRNLGASVFEMHTLGVRPSDVPAGHKEDGIVGLTPITATDWLSRR